MDMREGMLWSGEGLALLRNPPFAIAPAAVKLHGQDIIAPVAAQVSVIVTDSQEHETRLSTGSRRLGLGAGIARAPLTRSCGARIVAYTIPRLGPNPATRAETVLPRTKVCRTMDRHREGSRQRWLVNAVAF